VRALDVFSGIGGFALALDDAGFETSAFIEIDPKCQQLLAEAFPGVPIHADVKEVRGAELGPIDIVTGGFPCQDISIAGGRAGLAGDRSGLFYEIARLIEETQPRWVILENVAGLLGELGYGFAYRVLDARYFGVPQRRRRVFIVGRAGGDSRGPSEVLLEPEGVPGDSRSSGEAGEVVAALTRSGLGGGGPDDNLAQAGHLQPVILRMRSGKPGGGKGALLREDQSLTIATGNDQTLFQPTYVRSHTRTSMEDGDLWQERDQALTLAVDGNTGYAVRKLMPLECERLQGFPDGWTEGFSDTARYRMLGNAVAVPVVHWIADRIARWEAA